jgi:hypothetical protein
MNKVMKSRKYVVFLLLLLAMVVGTAVVSAAGTPIWWDNPGGVYTSWNTTGAFYGEASNNTGSNLTLIIENDVTTCNVGDHTELWMQISWVNTGTPNVGLRTSGTTNRFISWTEDASGCPASVTDPLPSDDGLSSLTNRLAFTPTGNSIPGNFPFDNGYERSFTFSDSLATCARTNTIFDIPDGGGFEYKVEVQSICISPTAVNLQSFTPAGNSTLPVVAFIGFLALVIVSFGVVIVRREQHKA